MSLKERNLQVQDIKIKDIINNAEKVFFAKGFSNSTMDDIASRAEMTKNTIYSFFKCKEDLFFAVVMRGYSILVSSMKEKSSNVDTGLKKIHEIWNTYYDFCKSYPEYYSLLIYSRQIYADFDTCPYAKELYKLDEDIIRLLVSSFNIGIKDGSIKHDLDSVKMAYFFVTVSSSLVDYSFKYKSILDKQYAFNQDSFILYSMDRIYDSLRQD